MKTQRLLTAGILLLTLGGLTACSEPTPSTGTNKAGTESSAPATMPPQTPVTYAVGELPDTQVTLKVGQVLSITTGDLAVDSYQGEVKDTAVAEFIPGRIDKTAQYNPGIKALAPGVTEVTLTNADGGIQAVHFTVTVVE